MPGASAETRRVTNLNANWRPGEEDGDGQFEIMLITDDDRQFTIATSPASLAAVVALARPDVVLAWDPTNATLIAANIVGQMPWTTPSRP
jgi:hypothetical protein